MSYRSSWICPSMVAIVMLAIPAGEGCATTASGVRPALPHEYVDTTVKSSPGRTLTVPAGGDFQAMLDEAQPGDEIVLTAGARYKGPFTLPYKKAGSGWITIRSENRIFAVGRANLAKVRPVIIAIEIIPTNASIATTTFP